jgi:hypothetical protein
VQDPEALRPMLYAIFAHEMGHELHGDTEPGATPTRELGADRFAGYSLERLGIRRLDPTEVTAYYQLTGDDFTGGDGTHGMVQSARRRLKMDGIAQRLVFENEMSNPPPALANLERMKIACDKPERDNQG